MDRRVIIGGVVLLAVVAVLIGVLSGGGPGSGGLFGGSGGAGYGDGGLAGAWGAGGNGPNGAGGDPATAGAGRDGVLADGGVPRDPRRRGPGPRFGRLNGADHFVSNGYEVGRIQARRQAVEARIERVNEAIAGFEAQGQTELVARQRRVLERLQRSLPELAAREETYRRRAESDGSAGDIERGLQETTALMERRRPQVVTAPAP